MLKKQIGKRVAALVSAAVMAASATTVGLSALSMTASASRETGEGTFEEGKGLPWHICESATAVMKFDITGGIYAVYIEKNGGVGNGGEGRWDVQFRHRNLTIDNGHTYRLTFSVNPSKTGTMYPKLGDMSDDNAEFWHSNGTPLTMTYEPGITQDALEQKLRSAPTSGAEVAYGQGWDAFKQTSYPANTWTTVAWEFTVGETNSETKSADGTGEWTFHMGGTTPQYGQDKECFPNDTVVRFDNLALIDMTNSASDFQKEAEYEPTGLAVNQIGYYPNAKKEATLIVEQGDSKAYDFEVQDASGKAVYTGTTDGNVIYDEGGRCYNQIIDFTDFTEEGTGYKVVCNGKTSYAFDIAKDLFSRDNGGASLLTHAVNYFYQNRSGVTTQDQYIPSEQTAEGSAKKLGREDCHNPDTAFISDEWVMQYTEQPTASTQIDLTGGWYDAGDYGKYVVNGGISLWTLMNMYERSVMNGTESKWDGTDIVNIPASDGFNTAVSGAPNILNECKVELDFFLKMMRDDGLVYHKMHDYKWTGLAVAPYDDDEDAPRGTGSKRPMRITKPVTLAATLNAAASFAQASRLFKPYDASYASELEAAAIKCYNAAKANYAPFDGKWDVGAGVTPDLYAPFDQNKGGGPYGDDDVSDEFYWAQCELYITTGDKAYYDELMSYGSNTYGKDNGKALEVSTVLVGGENNGTTSMFTWGTLNSVGSISLFVNSAKLVADGKLTQAEADTLKDQIVRAGDYYLNIQDKSAFRIPYVGHDYDASIWRYDDAAGVGMSEDMTLEGGYEWGSNSMVINNSMALALAYDATGDVKYVDGVTTAFDYLLGRNPLDQSYVTGYGEHSTTYPHHRWWSGQLNNTDFPFAPYGVLSGGPNSNMEDPMVQGAGYKRGELAPMKCYLDNVEAWSVNECTINWNSPLAWVASFLDDEGPNIQRDGSKTTTSTTTTEAGGETTTTAAVTTTKAGTDSDVIDGSTTQRQTATLPSDVDPASILLGDTNLDQTVDITDAVLLNKKLAGAVEFNAQQNANADCYDQGGEVDQKDAIALLKFIVQSLKSLPELG